MDSEIEWHEPNGFPYPGTYRGPDDVLNNMFMKLSTEWDGWEATPYEFIDGGNVIAVLGHYSGVYRSTGKGMRTPFAHYWRFENEKVKAFRTYMDTVLVQQALDSSGGVSDI